MLDELFRLQTAPMNRLTAKLKEIKEHPFVVSTCTVLGLLGIGSSIFAWVKGIRTLDTYAVIFLGVICTIASVTAVLNLRSEVVNLRASYKQIHRINHLYRDALTSVVSEAVELCELRDGKQPITGEELTARLLQAEEKTLWQVCQKIADTFTMLTNRKVICSVRTYDEERKLAVLWARSESGLERDNTEEFNELIIGSERNTAFDESIKRKTSGPSHFYSPDLIRDRNAKIFECQRSGWESSYKSCIHVPIICRDGNDGEMDLLGWLYVDTFSPNRLRDDYHVELLAAFADQMYNCISIMRTGYNIPEVA